MKKGMRALMECTKGELLRLMQSYKNQIHYSSWNPRKLRHAKNSVSSVGKQLSTKKQQHKPRRQAIPLTDFVISGTAAA